jgi:hypothetical protein
VISGLKNKKFKEKMEASLIFLSKTAEGLHVLRYLYLTSGFSLRSIVQDQTGRVDINATLHNEARRDNYIDLRNFMTPEVIKAVELDIPTIDLKEGDKNGGE